MTITNDETVLSSDNKLHNDNAERSLLAILLNDDNLFNEYIDQVHEDLFYDRKNKLIYQYAYNLYRKDINFDYLILNDSLIKDKSINDINKFSKYLEKIYKKNVNNANIKSYVNLILEKYKIRSLLNICETIANDIKIDNIDETATDLIEKAERKLFQLSKKNKKNEFLLIKPLLKENYEKVCHLYKNKNVITGLPTDFGNLDSLTNGFQKSDLIILAARPSMGKTAFALNITENIAVNNNKGVAFFSLEMSRDQLCQRLFSSFSKVPSQSMKTGFLREEQILTLSKALPILSKTKIFIDDSPTLRTMDIKSKLRRLLSKNDISIIVIDYLQLIQPNVKSKYSNRQNEVAEISRELKAIAKEFDKPVLVLSQLSRSVEQRSGDKRPTLSDLRDSGAIEQDADLVLFIYREDYYDKDSYEARGSAEIIIAKHRNGPIGTAELAFCNKTTRFYNVEAK